MRLLLTAMSMALLPFTVGLLGGRAVLRVSNRARRLAGIAGLVAIGLLPWIGPWLRPGPILLGAWDMATLSTAFVVGVILSRASSEQHFGARLALGAGSFLLALGVAEFIIRALLAPFPAHKLRPAADQTLLLPETADDGTPYVASHLGWNNRACSNVFINDFPTERERALEQVRHTTLRVLHVGDSMVETSGPAQRAPRFTELIERAMPGSAHLNAGRSDTGPDAYLSAIRAWLKLTRIDLVVVYFFPGNDVTDVDRPFACCEQDSLLRYEGNVASPRCASPAWPSRRQLWWLNSQPPFPLRAATGVSELARYGTYLVHGGPKSNLPLEANLDEARWSEMRIIYRTMRDELAAAGVPLHAVLLPYREAIAGQRAETGAVFRDVASRWTELMKSLGIPWSDAWALFEDRTASAPSHRWFLTTPQEPMNSHFNVDGHTLLAGWLRERIAWPDGVPDAEPREPEPEPQNADACAFLEGVVAADVQARLDAWLAQTQQPQRSGWGLHLDRAQATVAVELPAGTYEVKWSLAPDCRVADPVEVAAKPGFRGVLPTRDQARALAEGFPAPVTPPNAAVPAVMARSAWPGRGLLIGVLAIGMVVAGLLAHRHRRRTS